MRGAVEGAGVYCEKVGNSGTLAFYIYPFPKGCMRERALLKTKAKLNYLEIHSKTVCQRAEKRMKMGFDYERLEKNLLEAVEEYAASQLDQKDDMYIMSIEYFPEFTTFIAIRANTYSYLKEQVDEDDESYTYYKYCEEEWDLYEDVKEISSALQAEYNEMEKNMMMKRLKSCRKNITKKSLMYV